MALMALDEIAERCGQDPVPQSISLRFILAWLHFESGADPATKWLFDDFWKHATAPRTINPHGEMLDSYIRGTGARSALNGICRAIGWERTVSFEQEMTRRRRAD